MKKKKLSRYLAVGTAALLLAAGSGGCGSATNSSSLSADDMTAKGDVSSEQPDTSGTEESSSQAQEGTFENLAMYVPYGEDGSYVMVDQENGSVFTVTMPEEIYDAAGNPIKPEDLKKGNILTIYGNGIMLESYPGQYPGVSRIEVEEEGSPSDADQYQEIIDEIWQEPDPAELPGMNVDYTTSQAMVSAAADTGGYHWEYPAENGDMTSVIADTPFLTEWPQLNEICLEEPTDLTLSFTKTPVKVTAQRWPESVRDLSEELPDGEEMEVKAGPEDTQFLLEQAEPGFLYLIHAEWDNGYVEYGFQTVNG